MSFIGIIADCKDYEFIKKELKKGKLKSKIELININEKNIENVKNIKFETIVVCIDIKELNEKKEYLQNILKGSRYLIINSDLNRSGIETNSELKVITYGLNQKATVTASSIAEDSIMICIQRSIENAKSNIIEMQENHMESENITNKKAYSLMVIAVLKHIYN